MIEKPRASQAELDRIEGEMMVTRAGNLKWARQHGDTMKLHENCRQAIDLLNVSLRDCPTTMLYEKLATSIGSWGEQEVSEILANWCETDGETN